MRRRFHLTVTVLTTLLAAASPLTSQQLLKELYIPTTVNRLTGASIDPAFVR